jgi:hypothetical protein
MTRCLRKVCRPGADERAARDWLVFHWLRLPGDVAFLLGGGLVLVDVVAKLRHRRAAPRR